MEFQAKEMNAEDIYLESLVRLQTVKAEVDAAEAAVAAAEASKAALLAENRKAPAAAVAAAFAGPPRAYVAVAGPPRAYVAATLGAATLPEPSISKSSISTSTFKRDREGEKIDEKLEKPQILDDEKLEEPRKHKKKKKKTTAALSTLFLPAVVKTKTAPGGSKPKRTPPPPLRAPVREDVTPSDIGVANAFMNKNHPRHPDRKTFDCGEECEALLMLMRALAAHDAVSFQFTEELAEARATARNLKDWLHSSHFKKSDLVSGGDEWVALLDAAAPSQALDLDSVLTVLSSIDPKKTPAKRKHLVSMLLRALTTQVTTKATSVGFQLLKIRITTADGILTTNEDLTAYARGATAHDVFWVMHAHPELRCLFGKKTDGFGLFCSAIVDADAPWLFSDKNCIARFAALLRPTDDFGGNLPLLVALVVCLKVMNENVMPTILGCTLTPSENVMLSHFGDTLAELTLLESVANDGGQESFRAVLDAWDHEKLNTKSLGDFFDDFVRAEPEPEPNYDMSRNPCSPQ